MQNPFFNRQQYTHPSSRSRSDRGVPAKRPPKVVSIPVHFVDSEISRPTAAKRIQKVFRGFLVRKNVNKIARIKKQVVELEANLSLEETVDLIRKDDRERLKVNETLMSLLLKLDSVRSFDSGVRDFRKSVIKKVIVLQERLDAVIINQEIEEEEEEEPVNQIEHVGDTAEEIDEPIEEIKYPIEPSDDEDSNCEVKMEGECCDLVEQDEEVKEESVEEEIEKEEDTKEIVLVDGDERKEVMERMMEKNEILIGMVKELCEKNKMQTEIINSLSKRVDSLEKAFKRSICKKRKQTTPVSTDLNHLTKL